MEEMTGGCSSLGWGAQPGQQPQQGCLGLFFPWTELTVRGPKAHAGVPLTQRDEHSLFICVVSITETAPGFIHGFHWRVEQVPVQSGVNDNQQMSFFPPLIQRR